MTLEELQTELVNELPDGVINAVGDAFKDATTTTDFHEAIEAARKRLSLPPWHPITLLAKLRGTKLVSGPSYSMENLWITSKPYKKEVFTPQFEVGHEADWVTFDLVGEYKGLLSKPIRLSVHPEARLVWNHIIEYPVRTTMTIRFPDLPGETHALHIGAVIREAEKLLYGADLGDTIPVVTCHMRVMRCRRSKLEALVESSEEEVTKTAMSMREEEDPSEEATDVAAINEASNVVQHQKNTTQLKPVTQVVANTKILYPEDIEAITTMFEFASVLASNIGVKATIERWSKLMDKLHNKKAIPNEG